MRDKNNNYGRNSSRDAMSCIVPDGHAMGSVKRGAVGTALPSAWRGGSMMETAEPDAPAFRCVIKSPSGAMTLIAAGEEVIAAQPH